MCSAQVEEFNTTVEGAFLAIVEVAVEQMPLKYQGIYDITVEEVN
jgi:hypothetical protein